jgi:hypothetical protein
MRGRDDEYRDWPESADPEADPVTKGEPDLVDDLQRRVEEVRRQAEGAGGNHPAAG